MLDFAEYNSGENNRKEIWKKVTTAKNHIECNPIGSLLSILIAFQNI